VNIATAHSTKPSVEEAVREIRDRLIKLDPQLVLLFASPLAYDPAHLALALDRAFPGATTFGCSTAGEISNNGIRNGSMAAMAFGRGAIRNSRVEVMQGLRSGRADIETTISSLGRHFGVPAAEMDFRKYCGLILIDGLSLAEERVMDRIGDLSNIRFVGGSAGDDAKFETSYVFTGGKAYSDAAVLAILEPSMSFEILKTQSFRVLDQKLVVTKCTPASRTVEEFNGRPAAIAYAEALGVTVDELTSRFRHNPLGLMVGGEPYVRSPRQVTGDSVIFFCNIPPGTELSVLESTDIVADTRTCIEQTKQSMGRISGIINFHCILRTLELQSHDQLKAYGALFSEYPTVGFNTYGEQYVGHVNQTSTMVVFGE
jgi:hypothetical protein